MILHPLISVLELKNVATVAEPSNEEDDDEEAAYQKCVAFTPDGRHVVTGGTDGKIKVLKVRGRPTFPVSYKQSNIGFFI